MIKFDLLLAIEESCKQGYVLKNFNSMNLTLIPKTKNPSTFVDFRPISLCNSIYKKLLKQSILD